MTVANDSSNSVSGGHSLRSHVDGFGTRAIHVGSEPNPETGAVIPPISLSTTYKQDGVGNHKVCLCTRNNDTPLKTLHPNVGFRVFSLREP
jgi:cystathionine beta-lyase/cystathionine gamma-synthase